MPIYSVGMVLTTQQLSTITTSDGFIYVDDGVSGLRRFAYPWKPNKISGSGVILSPSETAANGVYDDSNSFQTPNADNNQGYQVLYSDATQLILGYARSTISLSPTGTVFKLYF